MSTRPFTPSPAKLQSMIDSAMAACDADIEQRRLAEEDRSLRRMEQSLMAAAKGRGLRRRWGEI